MRAVSFTSKAACVVAVCFLAIRGARLYFKNEVLISITEVIHLPEAAELQRQLVARPNLPLNITGKVEVETCVMRSYRFLLKLTGHVRCSIFAAERNTSASPRSARHRVVSMQSSGENSFSRSDSSFSTVSTRDGISPRKGNVTVVVDEVDAMVDAYEVDSSGVLCFTPACITETMLCKYSAITTVDGLGTVGRPASPPALGSGTGQGVGNVYVRSCYLQPDAHSAYGQRLIIDMEFLRVVYGLRLVIHLPSRHCRLRRADTGGVGRIEKPVGRPRSIIWEIGAVSEDMCGVDTYCSTVSRSSNHRGGVDSKAQDEKDRSNAVVRHDDDNEAAPRRSSARLVLVYERAPEGFTYGEADEDAGCSGDDEDDEDAMSTRGGRGRSTAQRSAVRRRESSAAQSNRARKREQRALKNAERSQKLLSRSGNGSLADSYRSMTSISDIPTVELAYSINSLLSGTSVRKLQVLDEKANWVPRSRFDRKVLRRLVPGLEQQKLTKLAQYATWFIQPVSITQI